MRLSGRNQRAYDRFERVVEVPMIGLSLLLIPIILTPILLDLDGAALTAVEVVAWLIWLAFVSEYLVLLWLAPDRRKMVRTHKLDLVIIALPLLRPLRILRVVRAGAILATAATLTRGILRRRGFGWILVGATCTVGIGAALVTVAEQGKADSDIGHFGDGLWWALVTVTTVGYGDYSPVTLAGRVIAVLLMIVGIGLLGTLTASIAAAFVEGEAEDDVHALRADIARLEEKLDVLLRRDAGYRD